MAKAGPENTAGLGVPGGNFAPGVTSGRDPVLESRTAGSGTGAPVKATDVLISRGDPAAEQKVVVRAGTAATSGAPDAGPALIHRQTVDKSPGAALVTGVPRQRERRLAAGKQDGQPADPVPVFSAVAVPQPGREGSGPRLPRSRSILQILMDDDLPDSAAASGSGRPPRDKQGGGHRGGNGGHGGDGPGGRHMPSPEEPNEEGPQSGKSETEQDIDRRLKWVTPDDIDRFAQHVEQPDIAATVKQHIFSSADNGFAVQARPFEKFAKAVKLGVEGSEEVGSIRRIGITEDADLEFLNKFVQHREQLQELRGEVVRAKNAFEEAEEERRKSEHDEQNLTSRIVASLKKRVQLADAQLRFHTQDEFITVSQEERSRLQTMIFLQGVFPGEPRIDNLTPEQADKLAYRIVRNYRVFTEDKVTSDDVVRYLQGETLEQIHAASGPAEDESEGWGLVSLGKIVEWKYTRNEMGMVERSLDEPLPGVGVLLATVEEARPVPVFQTADTVAGLGGEGAVDFRFGFLTETQEASEEVWISFERIKRLVTEASQNTLNGNKRTAAGGVFLDLFKEGYASLLRGDVTPDVVPILRGQRLALEKLGDPDVLALLDRYSSEYEPISPGQRAYVRDILSQINAPRRRRALELMYGIKSTQRLSAQGVSRTMHITLAAADGLLTRGRQEFEEIASSQTHQRDTRAKRRDHHEQILIPGTEVKELIARAQAHARSREVPGDMFLELFKQKLLAQLQDFGEIPSTLPVDSKQLRELEKLAEPDFPSWLDNVYSGELTDNQLILVRSAMSLMTQRQRQYLEMYYGLRDGSKLKIYDISRALGEDPGVVGPFLSRAKTRFSENASNLFNGRTDEKRFTGLPTNMFSLVDAYAIEYPVDLPFEERMNALRNQVNDEVDHRIESLRSLLLGSSLGTVSTDTMKNVMVDLYGLKDGNSLTQEAAAEKHGLSSDQISMVIYYLVKQPSTEA